MKPSWDALATLAAAYGLVVAHNRDLMQQWNYCLDVMNWRSAVRLVMQGQKQATPAAYQQTVTPSAEILAKMREWLDKQEVEVLYGIAREGAGDLKIQLTSGGGRVVRTNLSSGAEVEPSRAEALKAEIWRRATYRWRKPPPAPLRSRTVRVQYANKRRQQSTATVHGWAGVSSIPNPRTWDTNGGTSGVVSGATTVTAVTAAAAGFQRPTSRPAPQSTLPVSLRTSTWTTASRAADNHQVVETTQAALERDTIEEYNGGEAVTAIGMAAGGVAAAGAKNPAPRLKVPSTPQRAVVKSVGGAALAKASSGVSATQQLVSGTTDAFVSESRTGHAGGGSTAVTAADAGFQRPTDQGSTGAAASSATHPATLATNMINRSPILVQAATPSIPRALAERGGSPANYHCSASNPFFPLADEGDGEDARDVEAEQAQTHVPGRGKTVHQRPGKTKTRPNAPSTGVKNGGGRDGGEQSEEGRRETGAVHPTEQGHRQVPRMGESQMSRSVKIVVVVRTKGNEVGRTETVLDVSGCGSMIDLKKTALLRHCQAENAESSPAELERMVTSIMVGFKSAKKGPKDVKGLYGLQTNDIVELVFEAPSGIVKRRRKSNRKRVSFEAAPIRGESLADLDPQPTREVTGRSDEVKSAGQSIPTPCGEESRDGERGLDGRSSGQSTQGIVPIADGDSGVVERSQPRSSAVEAGETALSTAIGEHRPTREVPVDTGSVVGPVEQSTKQNAGLPECGNLATPEELASRGEEDGEGSLEDGSTQGTIQKAAVTTPIPTERNRDGTNGELINLESHQPLPVPRQVFVTWPDTGFTQVRTMDEVSSIESIYERFKIQRNILLYVGDHEFFTELTHLSQLEGQWDEGNALLLEARLHPSEGLPIGVKGPLSSHISLDETLIAQLRKSYTAFRRILGDGNCYYRAAFFGILEFAALATAEERGDIVAAVLKVLQSEVAYTAGTYEDRAHQALLGDLPRISSLALSSEMLATTHDRAIVMACKRLVASGLKFRAESQEEGTVAYAISSSFGGMSVDEFVDSQVLPLGKSAEGPHVELGILFGCFNFDGVIASAQRGHSLSTSCSSVGESRAGTVHLLHIATRAEGHYDLLYQRRRLNFTHSTPTTEGDSLGQPHAGPRTPPVTHTAPIADDDHLAAANEHKDSDGDRGHSESGQGGEVSRLSEPQEAGELTAGSLTTGGKVRVSEIGDGGELVIGGGGEAEQCDVNKVFDLDGSVLADYEEEMGNFDQQRKAKGHLGPGGEEAMNSTKDKEQHSAGVGRDEGRETEEGAASTLRHEQVGDSEVGKQSEWEAVEKDLSAIANNSGVFGIGKEAGKTRLETLTDEAALAASIEAVSETLFNLGHSDPYNKDHFGKLVFADVLNWYCQAEMLSEKVEEIGGLPAEEAVEAIKLMIDESWLAKQIRWPSNVSLQGWADTGRQLKLLVVRLDEVSRRCPIGTFSGNREMEEEMGQSPDKKEGAEQDSSFHSGSLNNTSIFYLRKIQVGNTSNMTEVEKVEQMAVDRRSRRREYKETSIIESFLEAPEGGKQRGQGAEIELLDRSLCEAEESLLETDRQENTPRPPQEEVEKQEAVRAMLEQLGFEKAKDTRDLAATAVLEEQTQHLIVKIEEITTLLSLEVAAEAQGRSNEGVRRRRGEAVELVRKKAASLILPDDNEDVDGWRALHELLVRLQHRLSCVLEGEQQRWSYASLIPSVKTIQCWTVFGCFQHEDVSATSAPSEKGEKPDGGYSPVRVALASPERSPPLTPEQILLLERWGSPKTEEGRKLALRFERKIEGRMSSSDETFLAAVDKAADLYDKGDEEEGGKLEEQTLSILGQSVIDDIDRDFGSPKRFLPSFGVELRAALEQLGMKHQDGQHYRSNQEFVVTVAKEVARLLVRSEQIALFLGLKRRLAAKNRTLSKETHQKLARLRSESDGNYMLIDWPEGEGEGEWASMTEKIRRLHRCLEQIRAHHRVKHPTSKWTQLPGTAFVAAGLACLPSVKGWSYAPRAAMGGGVAWGALMLMCVAGAAAVMLALLHTALRKAPTVDWGGTESRASNRPQPITGERPRQKGKRGEEAASRGDLRLASAVLLFWSFCPPTAFGRRGIACPAQGVRSSYVRRALSRSEDWHICLEDTRSERTRGPASHGVSPTCGESGSQLYQKKLFFSELFLRWRFSPRRLDRRASRDARATCSRTTSSRSLARHRLFGAEYSSDSEGDGPTTTAVVKWWQAIRRKGRGETPEGGEALSGGEAPGGKVPTGESD
jgi:hypothetical protein